MGSRSRVLIMVDKADASMGTDNHLLAPMLVRKKGGGQGRRTEGEEKMR